MPELDSWRELLHEVVGQQRDVLRPVLEVRQRDRDDVQPVVEVLAEGPLLDGLLEVPVGGGDHPDVDLDGPGAPDALDLPLLEGPEDLRLEVEPHGAHLVQEQGPAGGELELAHLGGDGPREGPLLVAEELRLQELRRDGGAVDGDEVLGGALAVVVDGLGHQLLPRPALPVDHHGAAAAGHLLDQAEHLLHGPALSDQVLEVVPGVELLAERADLVPQATLVQGLLDGEEHLVDLEGLVDVVVGAFLHRLDGLIDGAEGGHDDDHDIRVQLLDGPQGLHAAQTRHADIRHHQIDRLLLQEGQSLRPVAADGGLKAFPLQDLCQQVPHLLFVVHDQDALVRTHAVPPSAGSQMVKVVPCPTSLATSMLP